MPEITIQAEKLFSIGTFQFTNAYLLSLIVFTFIIVVGLSLSRKISLVPGMMQSIAEMAIEKLLTLMDSILGNRQLSEKYLPIAATVFVAILFSNWFGLLPGVGPIAMNQIHHGHEIAVPLFRAPTSDLNFTVALGMISIFAVNLFGFLALGFKRHAGKFFTFKNPIYTFVGLLEFVSEFVKIISFSFRLFGNIFAGEVLLGIVGFLVPFFIPLPFLFLEVFVGFIQAFIFTTLTLVFISMSIADHEAHEEAPHSRAELATGQALNK